MVNRIRENVPYEEIGQDPHNANKGTERGDYMLRRSLEKGGPVRSAAVDANGVPIAGNHVIAMAKEMNIPITVIPTHGEALIVHQRLDLDMSDPGGLAREMAIMDNRTSQVGLDWEKEELKNAHESGIDLLEMFWPAELKEMDFDLAEMRGAREDEQRPYYPDESLSEEEMPVFAGQTYACGEHLLTIGAASKPGDAEVMMRAYEKFTGKQCRKVSDE